MLWKININVISKKSLLSAFLLFFSFPKFGHYTVAWISLVPYFLYMLSENNKKNALLNSFVVGFVFCLGIFYWISKTLYVGGANLFISILLWALLCLYLSLYFVGFGFVFLKFKQKSIYFIVFMSCVWVLLEFLRNYLFTGFPWALIGYSQWQNLIVIQISEYVGVYGISFLIVLVNLYIAMCLKEKKFLLKPCVLFFVLFLSVFSYGYVKLNVPKKEVLPSINVGILQGNIDQYKKFDSKYIDFIIERYVKLVHELKDSNLVVWPETSYPYIYTGMDFLEHRIKNALLKKTHVLGVISFLNKKYYNSAVLFDNKAQELLKYDKIHLVPFGEVFPFKEYIEKFFTFTKSIELGGIEKGKSLGIFYYNKVPFGVNICFEMLFPNEFRKICKAGAKFVVNITNDAWYLKTSAPYQHLSFSVFRAIENRCYIIRAANTGISAIFDDKGRIINFLGLYKTGIIEDKVFLSEYNAFYTKFGDVFVLLCFGFILYYIIKKK